MTSIRTGDGNSKTILKSEPRFLTSDMNPHQEAHRSWQNTPPHRYNHSHTVPSPEGFHRIIVDVPEAAPVIFFGIHAVTIVTAPDNVSISVVFGIISFGICRIHGLHESRQDLLISFHQKMGMTNYNTLCIYRNWIVTV